MHCRRAFILTIAFGLVGCGRSRARYEQAIANAVKSEPNAVAFEKVYPGSEHFISYYDDLHGTPRWNSKALIQGRYVLTMQFDISIEASGTVVNAVALPQYYLVEVSDVTTSPSGQTIISYDSKSQREFGLREWKALEANGGDISPLGIHMKRDQPVRGLAARWKGA